jgi:hypothetical protein
MFLYELAPCFFFTVGIADDFTHKMIRTDYKL